MSLVKPEMSLVKFQNVPGKFLVGVATLWADNAVCSRYMIKSSDSPDSDGHGEHAMNLRTVLDGLIMRFAVDK